MNCVSSTVISCRVADLPPAWVVNEVSVGAPGEAVAAAAAEEEEGCAFPEGMIFPEPMIDLTRRRDPSDLLDALSLSGLFRVACDSDEGDRESLIAGRCAGDRTTPPSLPRVGDPWGSRSIGVELRFERGLLRSLSDRGVVAVRSKSQFRTAAFAIPAADATSQSGTAMPAGLGPGPVRLVPAPVALDVASGVDEVRVCELEACWCRDWDSIVAKVAANALAVRWYIRFVSSWVFVRSA